MPHGKITTVLAIVFIFLFSPRAGFAYPVHGVGTSSCAEFAKMYQGDPEISERVFFSWAQGFMSGLNLGAKANNKQMRDLAGIVDDQKRALRAYCANNPLKSYMDAVIGYYAQLPVSPP